MGRTIRSPSGGIHLQTTERGLPTALTISQRELSRAPRQLAHHVLLLCQGSAKRAQLARRRALLTAGFSLDVVNALKLSTEDELARAEGELVDDPDVAQSTWLRPV